MYSNSIALPMINEKIMKKTSFIFLLLMIYTVAFSQENSGYNDTRGELPVVKNASLTYSEPFPEIPGTFTLKSVQEVCHTLEFSEGWNLFSAPLIPASPDMKEIFQVAMENGTLIKIQDDSGETLDDWGIYGNWKNTIGNLSPAKGYYLKANSAFNLQLCGNPVTYPYAIPLHEGWNIVGFPNTNAADGLKVAGQLIDRNTLQVVEDEAGNTISYSGGWQNSIGDFVPGKAYRIRLSEPDTLWIAESYEPDYELQVRSGLPNFLQKVKSGQRTTVVYFGGSITYAEGWRPQTAAWMSEYFNNNNINAVNASIGGTTSEFGAFRTEQDVLVHQPDLVLVEFAVNDSDREYASIVQSMEGIVRQIKEASSTAEICFVYTLKQSLLNNVMPDNLFTAAKAMEEVADHYAIPSINFGPEVKKRIDEGTLIFSGDTKYINGVPVFSKDGVHPYIETGHVVYTDVFKRAIKKIESSPAGSKVYPSPLRSDNLQDATMAQLSDENISLSGSWELLSSSNFPSYDQFGDRASGAMFSDTPGDNIKFRFRGTTFGLTDIIGPRSGYLEVQIDGGTPFTIKRFDPWCHYYRIHFFTVKGLSDSEHEVTITLLDADIDKQNILKDTSGITSNPEDYEGPEWYPIRLLLVGDLVTQ